MSVLTIRAHRRYAMRLPVRLKKDGGKPAPGLLIEISQKGARISSLGTRTYEAGQTVRLVMPCGAEIAGRIRWAHDGVAGLHLDNPLHAPEMARFIEMNRDHARDQDPLFGT